MRRVVAIMLAGAMLSGCVSVPKQAVSDQAVAGWQGRSIAVTERPREAMVAMTAGKAAFGLIGAAAAVESGKSIVTENGIKDPAPEVARALVQVAQQRYGVVPAAIGPVKTNSTDIAAVAAAAHGADLLIDVQSLGESINYFPTNWSHYWVSSGLVLRVIDVRRGVVLGGGMCHRDSRHDSSPPTRDDLLAAHGELLKQMLGVQWDSCRDELAQKFLPAKG